MAEGELARLAFIEVELRALWARHQVEREELCAELAARAAQLSSH